MVNKPHFLIDAGYLSWIYGSKAQGINAWNMARMKYSSQAGGLMLLDSPKSVRKEEYPEYKAHRKDRRDVDPRKKAAHARVKSFRVILAEDPSVRSIGFDKLEADDLVAMVIGALPSTEVPWPVIGGDKDLLQIPRHDMILRKTDETEVNMVSFIKRQPKAIQPFLKERWQVLLVLSLLGDSSDNVPKIMPPRAFSSIIDLFQHKAPFSQAYQRFGSKFYLNIRLTILPHLTTLENTDALKPEALFSHLDETFAKGIRWYGIDTPFPLKSEYQHEIIQSVQELGQGQIYSQADLFDDDW